MAKLSVSGAELLRVQKAMPAGEGYESMRQRAYFAKGAILHKTGHRRAGASWEWSSWTHLRNGDGKPLRRDIGLESIRAVRDQLEADGWQLLFWGCKEWK